MNIKCWIHSGIVEFQEGMSCGQLGKAIWDENHKKWKFEPFEGWNLFPDVLEAVTKCLRETGSPDEESAKRFEKFSNDELIEYFLNSRTTYYQSGGHGKAERNRLQMEAFWSELVRRKVENLEEITKREGSFNGRGSS